MPYSSKVAGSAGGGGVSGRKVSGGRLLQSYVVGDKVTDPERGFATVTFVGTERIGLCFEESGHHALLAIEAGSLHRGWDASLLIDEEPEDDARPLSWPDSTFVAEADDAQHFMGSHWDAFHEEGVTLFLKQMPAIVAEAALLSGFGEFYMPARQQPDAWVNGTHLVWPEQNRLMGLAITLRFNTETNELVSFYPYVDAGIQITICLDRVRVWDGGVEAQIDAVWGEAPITFFDTAFLLNRGWYEADCDYDFLLAGVAYEARPAEAARIPFTPNPDQIAWERMLAEYRGKPPPEIPEYIDFSGAALFLGIPEWDADDYSFRSPIKTVEPFDDFLGQTGWKVRATVMRFGDTDADLDIYITRRAWQGEEPPRPGQDIEGRLWLQGRLWSAPQAWEVGMRKER